MASNFFSDAPTTVLSPIFKFDETRADGDLTGQARIIDGDTIEVAATRIRLEGIDAPERGQGYEGRLIRMQDESVSDFSLLAGRVSTFN